MVDRRHLLPGLAAFLAASAVALIGLRATALEPARPAPAPKGPVELQLLGVNDLHAHLEPPKPGLGGTAWLNAHLRRAEGSHPGRTIRVHAGDMAGATPLISSHFHDEPGVEAMNRMRFDVGTLGNHEFDEGAGEALRLVRGGRRQGPEALKSDAAGRLENTSDPSFGGVEFPTVAANTVTADGRLLLPPYSVVERGGVKVGFIGVTTATTPNYLLPRHSRPYRWLDASESVNRWVPELQRRGVEAIVVLAHSGGFDGAGEIFDEARQMDDAVDVVVAGHTHSLLNHRVDGKLVVQALSYGTAFERIRVTVDPRSGDITSKAAEVVRASHEGITPDAGMADYVRRLAERVAPLGDRVLGTAGRRYTRTGGELGELVADAQRAHAGTDLAFVNPGNMRDDIEPGPVTYAELFEVQAYEHPLLRMRMRGSAVLELLAQQHRDGSYTKLYTSGMRGPADIDPERTYSVAANELIAEGERFPALRDRARGKRPVGTDLEALSAWVEQQDERF